MSRSKLHDWEYHIERCCKENLPFEMREIAEDIYNTAYERGKNAKEPKTGHWYRKYEYGNLYCSKCNHEYLGLNHKPKFCEECGARMSEVSE